MDSEEIACINSEIRFIALELMKLAVQRNASFDSVMKEFIENAYKLKFALTSLEEKKVIVERKKS